MHEQYLVGLAAILVVGVAARWIAWKLHLPSILLLLACGIVAGPLTGYLNPDALFGPVLMPMISLSVGVILFEGGLSLNFRELKQMGGVVTRLVTMGVAVTWLLGTVGAFIVLRLELPIAVLIGAILVVSGPTVVIPLLEHVRPRGQVSTVVRWEGILNDPVGALLAVVVYEAILTGQAADSGAQFLEALGIGVLAGFVGAALLLVFLRYYLLPDYLQNPFSLSVVVLVFTVSNHLSPESGLLATTLMGVVLANQRWVVVRHIVEFKENLRVLVISTLFILLAARLKPSDFEQLGWKAGVFLAILLFIVRPAAVWASTVGSKLTGPEREFLSWMAPRGIVAAAVTSIFAERLVEVGVAGAEKLVPIVFLVIIGTVAVYGLAAFPVARRLGLAESKPQGVLFVGAHNWVREMALCLKQAGMHVVLADSNQLNVNRAQLADLPTHFGSILSEHVLEGIDLYGLGRLVALTSNDEANSLGAFHFTGIFGRKEVYQLVPEAGPDAGRKVVSPLYLSGRFLFDDKANYAWISAQYREGAKPRSWLLTKQFGWEHWQEEHEDALPLFVVSADKELTVVAAGRKIKPKAGDTVIALAKDIHEEVAGLEGGA